MTGRVLMEAIERVSGREVFREVSLPPIHFQMDCSPSRSVSDEYMAFLNAILHSLVDDESHLRLYCVDVFLKARYGNYHSL